MYIYMYVCIYIYIHIHIYVYLYRYMPMRRIPITGRTIMSLIPCFDPSACTQTYVYIYVYMYICRHTHTLYTDRPTSWVHRDPALRYF